MSDPFVGEIRMFAGTFAPRDWAFCDGTQYNISDYPPLFSLIGITYGGDGVTKFAVPDLKGRLPIGQGQGASLTNRAIGSYGGTETAALTTATMPSHSHLAYGSTAAATQTSAQGAVWAAISGVNQFINPSEVTVTTSTVIREMNTACILSSVSPGTAHGNVMPSLAINFIICLNGEYPYRQ